MTATTLFLGLALLLLAGCAPGALAPLVIDGPDLHPSLRTRPPEDAAKLLLPRALLRDNPYLSTDGEFVDIVSRIASQDRCNGRGIRAALYALYVGERELGLYGLEAESSADADRVEGTLRGIWAHNAALDRARVHREGRVLVVVWHDGVSPLCWEAVNAKVLGRLTAHHAEG